MNNGANIQTSYQKPKAVLKDSPIPRPSGPPGSPNPPFNLLSGSPLGNTANFSAKTNKSASNQLDISALRQINYDMKNASCDALCTCKKFTTKKDKVTGEIKSTMPRIWHCGRTPIVKSAAVEYVKGVKGKNYFAGLQKCASYWVCPVCALKIAQEKSKLFYAAMEEYKALGYNVYFLTLTFPHYKGQRLQPNKDFLIKGWNYINAHRDTRNLDYEFVRSIEVTYGSNGFHPHLHIVVITKKTLAEIELPMKKLWLSRIKTKLKKALNEKESGHAFKLISWDNKTESLSEYLFKKEGNYSKPSVERKAELVELSGKWTLAKELVKSHMKHSKKKESLTPFDFLHEMATGELLVSFEHDPEKLFIEFAEAFKGTRACSPSKGFFVPLSADIKAKSEVTDQELVEDDKKDQRLFLVDRKLWKVINDNRLKAKVINAYESNGLEHLRSCIEYELIKLNKSKVPPKVALLEGNILYLI